MSTSGITINELTRDQIITRALRKIGVLGEGNSANPTQISEAADTLGPLVQEMQTLGMPLWKRTDYVLPLVSGQKDYVFGIGEAISIPFPMKLYQAVMQYAGSNSKIDVEIKSKYDFQLLPSNSTGMVVSVTYQPFINHGILSVWPTPNTNDQQLTITYQAPFDIFSSGTNTADFPQEWQNALIYHLALLLADEYGLPLPDKEWLAKQADKHLASALSFGEEDASLWFHPSYKGTRHGF